MVILLGVYITLLCVIVPKTEAFETHDLSRQPKGDVYRKVLIQFVEDGPVFSPRALPAIIAKILLVLELCTCSIEDAECKCCFSMEYIGIKSCCLRVRYSQPESAIKATVSYGEANVMEFHISVSSNTEVPPACYENTESELLQVCFHFYGVGWTDESRQKMRACSKVELNVLKRNVFDFDIGCFELAIGKAIAFLSGSIEVFNELEHVAVKLSQKERVALKLRNEVLNRVQVDDLRKYPLEKEERSKHVFYHEY